MLETMDRGHLLVICSCMLSLTKGWARECVRVHFDTRLDRKLMTSWEVKSLGQVDNVSSDPVCCDTSIVEPEARALNHSHTISKKYGLPYLREKAVHSVQIRM